MKYRRHDLHGLLLVDKSVGPTSMEAVRQVRRAAGHCKTGHAGTLDPLASGLLVCGLGRGTRQTDALMGMTKVYLAGIDLSAFSHTDDAEGPLEPIPAAQVPGDSLVREVLDRLTGEIMQRPPAFSAIKLQGRRAYDLARSGQRPEIAPRPIRIDRMDLLTYAWPHLEIRVTCGKGTYIRSLARQIGESLGCGGYLTSLRREAIGPYRVEQALPLDHLPDLIQPEHLALVLPGPEPS